MRSSIVAVGGSRVVSAGPAAHMRGRFIRRFQPLVAAAGSILAVVLVVRVTFHGGGFIGCVVYGVGITDKGGVGLHHAPLHISHRVTLN